MTEKSAWAGHGLHAPAEVWDTPAGPVTVYRAGQGPAVLLLHSVNAVASVAEVRPVFEGLQGSRTVYAMDLPGFGGSDRSDRPYTVSLMCQAIQAVGERIRLQHGGGPLDALALSLTCEFLARVAAQRPAAWGRLALVSPTGLQGSQPRRGPAGSTAEVPGMRKLLRWAGLGRRLFGLLTRPAVIRYFLRRTFGRRDIDEQLWRDGVRCARAPGAHWAPLAFLSGALFSRDALSVYAQLTHPVWMSHGVRGDFTDYRQAQAAQLQSPWAVTVYDTGAIPYFEQPGRFVSELTQFFEQPPQPAVRDATA